MRRSRHFLKHKVDILRSNFAVDVTTIRDRVISGYTTVKSSARCWIETAGSQTIFDDQLGAQGLAAYTVWFDANEDVRVGDILQKSGTSTFYEVRGVSNWSDVDWHLRADVSQKNFHRAQ